MANLKKKVKKIAKKVSVEFDKQGARTASDNFSRHSRMHGGVTPEKKEELVNRIPKTVKTPEGAIVYRENMRRKVKVKKTTKGNKK